MFRNKFTKLILILILLLPGGQVFAARQQAGANAWYVSPAGSDANSCLTPAEPCATLKGVVGKAAGGDTIKAAAGIYTGLNWEVVRVEKSLVISGGWNSDFSLQTGLSVVDGQGTRGGIYVLPGNTVSIDHFFFTNSTWGLQNQGTLTVMDSSFSNNSGWAGIVNGGSLTLVNSTVISNQGIGIANDYATLNLNNVTISNNTGPGLSVRTISTAALSNTIISGNDSAGSGNDCSGGPVNSAGNNLLGNLTGCAYTSAAGDQLNANPQLNAFLPADGYQPLLAGSPAIDAGNPASCAPTDQRGLPRVGVCDIGAYEYAAPGAAARLSIERGDHQLAYPGAAFNRPLQVAALDSQGSPVSGVTIHFDAPASGASGSFAEGGGNQTSGMSDVDGLVSTSIFTANGLSGTYSVMASAAGLDPVLFSLINGVWYVAPGGDDLNTCLNPAQPCATINAAIFRAESGQVVEVAVGSYVIGETGEGVSLNRSIHVQGGWDPGFTVQNGRSTILDYRGQYDFGTHYGILVYSGVTASLDGFDVIGVQEGLVNTGQLTVSHISIQDSRRWGVMNEGQNASLTISDSIIRDSKDRGIVNSANTSVSLVNTTVFGNRGGGIWNAGALSLNNVTISGNSRATTGGGILNSGSVSISNSIVAGNSVTNDGPDCYGPFNSTGNNILGSRESCDFTAAGGDQVNVDPQLGTFLPALGYLPLMAGSPAIDAGNPASCAPTDQRGLPRVGVCDIGAYEYTAPGADVSISIFDGNPQHTPPNTAFPRPLRVLALDGQGSPVGGLAVTFTAPGSGASGVFTGSGSNSLVVNTDGSGMASVNLSANSLMGGYTVQAAASGLNTLSFAMKNLNWYISTLGSDANSCDLPQAPCASLQAVLGRPDIQSGDTVFVASGTYTGTANIGASIQLLGGWNESFTSQNGIITIDGPGTNAGIQSWGAMVLIENFAVTNTGIAIYQAGGNLTLKHCEISGTNVNTYGGAILDQGGRLTMTDCSIHDNKDKGISVTRNSIVEINNSSISYSQNTALAIEEGTVTLKSTTISGNTSARFIAGIANAGGDLTVLNSTISDNTNTPGTDTGGGGGIASYSSIYGRAGTVVLLDSIVTGNSAGIQALDCAGSGYTSGGNNIIGTLVGCHLAAAASDQINVDPKLGVFLPVQGYYPLTAGSPAIDAGNPATCASTDQRGLPRVGVCDIGAYEYRLPGAAASLIYFSGSAQRAAPNKTFVLPLRVAVLDAQGTPVSGVSVTFTAPGSGASGTFAGSSTSTVNSDGSGVAASALLTANNHLGTYTVTAAVSGVGAVNFSLLNLAWYVSKTGSDSSACNSPAAPCATINAAINKPDMQAGDTVLVAVGTYTGAPHNSVVYIPKSLTLSGGWNANFTSQVGISTVDSQVGSAGANVNSQVTAVIERFALINGVYGLSNLGTLTLEQCSITGNGIGPDHNPAIYNSGDLTINHSTISGNKGGGIQVGSNYDRTGTLTINDSTISGNSIPATLSTPGGALNVNPGTLVTITNSTISGNSASSGGAIFTSGGVIVLRNTTITNNAVTNHGASGIQTTEPYSYPGSISMQNSILAGNSQDAGGLECAGTIHSLGHNMVGIRDMGFCNFISAAGDQLGDSANPVDPLLTPLQDNGGPTLTHGFASLSSPAIDRGDPAACPASDQTGTPRPHGDGCDIGAIENTQPVVHISGSAGVGALFHFTNEKPLAILGDINGDYLLSLPLGWSGTVTPTWPEYRFDPVNRTYSNVLANQSGQNYNDIFTGGLMDTGFEFTSNPYTSHWHGFSTNSLITLCYLNTCGYGGSSGPRGGQGWARLGGTVNLEISQVGQDLILPANRPNLKLQFYLRNSAAGAGSSADDRFEVVIDYHTVLFSTNASQHSLYSSYTPVQVDISAYSDGRQHSLAFVSETSGQVVTFNVDDARLNEGLFFDVDTDYWARSWIEILANNGVTSGCGSAPLRYCPGGQVTRAEMAVFLLRGMHTASYSPPAATGSVFADVPASYWAAAWIEQLAKEGITNGCSANPKRYCPDNPVSRAEMAIFLLRSTYGAAFTPPAATGIFADVPVGYWADAWIEKLFADGITGGCSANPKKYCPDNSVTRDQMAVFLVRAFGLK